jgi:eukaryotic-like serine/threonine-protein kinase
VGRLVGSPDFVAPEQVENPKGVGPAADVYGLGATLYCLVTGRVPYPVGNKLERVLARLAGEPVPVELVRPDLPKAVVDVIRWFMSRRPTDRCASAAGAADALGAVASALPVAMAIPLDIPQGATVEQSGTVTGDTLDMDRPATD